MKALVLYYSRSGHTKKIAGEIATALQADIEELKDKTNRRGPIGFLRSGYESRRAAVVKLPPLSHHPADYDLVVVGTPVWAGNMSSAVRTLLQDEALSGVKVGWFCTAGARSASMHQGCFDGMTAESGLSPVATLGLGAGEVIPDHSQKLNEFVAKLRAAVDR